MTRFFRYIGVLLTFCFVATSLFSQNDVYESLVVERVDVNIINAPPETPFEPNSVLSRMKTGHGKVFSQIEFDEDLKALSQDYADVEPIVEIIEGRIYITLNISLKPFIRSIQWCGNYSISSGRLQRELGIGTGSVFDRTEFNRALFDVRKFYVKRGYFEADLDLTVEQDCTTN